MVKRVLAVLAVVAMIGSACDGGDRLSGPDDGGAPTTTTVRPTTTTTTVRPTTTLIPILPEISWSMPARFGLDTNEDGLLDLPNTAEYAHNLAPDSCAGGCVAGAPTFTVVLSGAGSTSEVGSIEEYRWEVRSGSELVADTASAAPETRVQLAEGSYAVSLTVAAAGQTATITDQLDVRDLLIVGIGDSYASGEGNPEANEIDRSGFFARAVGIWADDGGDGEGPVAESHRRSHRSTLAATPQAALELEAGDDRSSVTLLLVASSGARIDRGLIGPHSGVSYEQVGQSELPPQIDDIAAMLGCVATAEGPRCDRTIDALTISIGGNDVGFGQMVGSLVLADPALSVGGAYDFGLNQIFSLAEAGIRDLAGQYAALDEAVRTRLQVEQVYLVAYPSPVGSGDNLCNEAVDDLVPGLEADREEIIQVVERVVEPLGRAMAEAAATHGWVYVEAHLDDFASHGYCRSDPYPATSYPGNPFPLPVEAPADPNIRWVRRAEESTDIQGAPDDTFRPADLATRGTLHPNEYGHQSIRDALLAVLDFG